MSSLRDRTTRLLERLEESQILLVEWETSLWIRLGYPLAWNRRLFFWSRTTSYNALRY
ncbi:hypothetical protein V8C34DRAFT_301723 [Trichoderma compactum]